MLRKIRLFSKNAWIAHAKEVLLQQQFYSF